MSSESQRLTREPISHVLRGAMAVLAVLVIARLVLELAGMPPSAARALPESAAPRNRTVAFII